MERQPLGGNNVKDRQKYPNELFVRFIARNYYGVPDRSRVRVLDIGSGNGANSWFLAYEGFAVTALDKDEQAMAALKLRFKKEKFFREVEYLVRDIAKYTLPENCFDVIADINTLCHVPEAPMFSLRDALKKDGKFFCITPKHDTWQERVHHGKDFTWFRNLKNMEEWLEPFNDVEIHEASYPEGDHQMRSWICQANK